MQCIMMYLNHYWFEYFKRIDRLFIPFRTWDGLGVAINIHWKDMGIEILFLQLLFSSNQYWQPAHLVRFPMSLHTKSIEE